MPSLTTIAISSEKTNNCIFGKNDKNLASPGQLFTNNHSSLKSKFDNSEVLSTKSSFCTRIIKVDRRYASYIVAAKVFPVVYETRGNAIR